MKIALLSDTHSYIDHHILNLIKDCDQVWHAGDIGDLDVTDQIKETGVPLIAVYGNIDDQIFRREFDEDQIFEVAGLKVWMTHIGSYPPKYNTKIRKRLDQIKPDIFVCGHSHILKVIYDQGRQCLHLNPGAAGVIGFHTIRTMLLFEIKDQKPCNMNVVELGSR